MRLSSFSKLHASGHHRDGAKIVRRNTSKHSLVLNLKGSFFLNTLRHSISGVFHFVLRSLDALHFIHVATCAAVEQSLK